MSNHAPWFVLPRQAVIDSPVIVLGAGLAGCHMAFELATRNIRVLLLDAGSSLAAGASGNSVGIVKPFVTRNSGFTDQFYATAFNFLLHRLNTDIPLSERADFNACGVLQLLEKSYPPNPLYQICTDAQASQIAGTRIESNAIFFNRGGYLNPKTLCAALLKHENIDVQLNVCVNQIIREDSNWHLHISAPANKTINTDTLECGTLILANGHHINEFAQTKAMPITPARGQTSRFMQSATGDQHLQTVITGKRYAIPHHNSVVVGATFCRNNINCDVTCEDHENNRASLDTLLPSHHFDQKAVSGFCGIRATTPDRLPVVGPVPDFTAYSEDYGRIKDGLPASRFTEARYQKNLFVIGGFGSRGIVSAPYCAMLLAEQLCKATTSDTDEIESSGNTLSSWASLLHPGRFIIRALKRKI